MAVGLSWVALLVVGLVMATGVATAQPKAAQPVTDRLASALAPSASALPSLTPASAPPAPAPASVAGAPLAPHEVFAFTPYWTLPQAATFDVADLTTIAYFSVDVDGDGSIDESGPGWEGLRSQDLADLVTRAHEAGARVVLTATCFSQSSLDALTADPDQAGRTLGDALVGLLGSEHLDGANLDFEGTGGADRSGMVQLVTQVSTVLHRADPDYQLTIDTYGSSAADGDGFDDVAGLAPVVDAFFVMAYDMGDPSVPGPTAPLTGPGYTDESVVAQYTAVVPADKVILGTPFYGYDWPTTGPALGDPTTGTATAVTEAQVTAAGNPVYWDPTTETPWSAYEDDGQWHQVFFDDADSLAFKAQLAARSGLLGVGVWALGMDGDPSLLGALLGGVAPVHLPPPGPAVAGTEATGERRHGHRQAASEATPPSSAASSEPAPSGTASTGTPSSGATSSGMAPSGAATSGAVASGAAPSAEAGVPTGGRHRHRHNGAGSADPGTSSPSSSGGGPMSTAGPSSDGSASDSSTGGSSTGSGGSGSTQSGSGSSASITPPGPATSASGSTASSGPSTSGTGGSGPQSSTSSTAPVGASVSPGSGRATSAAAEALSVGGAT